MTKKIFLGLMLFSAFVWNESAQADRSSWCNDGEQQCTKSCKTSKMPEKYRVDCFLACADGLEACDPNAKASKK